MLSLVSLVALSSLAFARPSGKPDKSCTCGYKLTEYGDTYFPFHKRVTFGSLPNGVLSGPNALESLGFTITDVGTGVGGTYTDPKTNLTTQSFGDYRNLQVQNGELWMTFPGGQKAGTNLRAAEIHTTQDFVGGVFEVKMQLSPVIGTVQSTFTYHSGDGVQDEQDMEMLAYAFRAGQPQDTNGTPPGIELTNYDPTDPANERNANTIVPFPSDPTKGFHTYTIGWLPKKTQDYYDGKALKSPTKYYSKNPSNLYLNNWSSGDPNFTAGPPTQDVVMKVKSIEYYYATAAQRGLPSGCKKRNVCSV